VAAPAAAVTGTTATIRVACAAGGPACVGTLSVRTAAGRPLAAVRYVVAAGRVKAIKVRAKALRTARRAVVVVTGRDGHRVKRTLTLTRRH
jgi:hypothetical protein